MIQPTLAWKSHPDCATHCSDSQRRRRAARIEDVIMENPSRLRWGLVGTGGFADAVFAPVLRNAGQELLGAAGSSPQGSAAFAVRHGVPRTYASLEAMLRDPDIDAVWVASPNHLHEEHVRLALEAGKHVLAEKPLAITGSGARELADLSERLGRRLAVGYQGRFHGALRDLHARVREGALGEIAYVRASWQTRYAGLPDAWRLRQNTSGGWAIMDIGTHTLDAALWMTGFTQSRLLGSRRRPRGPLAATRRSHRRGRSGDRGAGSRQPGRGLRHGRVGHRYRRLRASAGSSRRATDAFGWHSTHI